MSHGLNKHRSCAAAAQKVNLEWQNDRDKLLPLVALVVQQLLSFDSVPPNGAQWTTKAECNSSCFFLISRVASE